MSFDLDLNFGQMIYQSQNPDPRKESSEPEVIESLIGSVPLGALPAAGFVSHDPSTKETHEGDRYWQKGSDLIEASTLDTIAFQKILPNSQRAEEFAKEYAKLIKRFTAKWKAKEASRQTIPTTFPDEIKPKEHLVYKKSGKRGRVFTGPQLAEHNEHQNKRKKREIEIDTERIRRHISLEKKDGDGEEEDAQEDSGQMGQKNTLDYFGYDEDVDKDANTMIVSPVGEDSHNFDLPIAVDSSSDEEFPSIDRLYSMSQGGENIQNTSRKVISASQFAPISSTITTRASRGVSKPSKVQKELESQEQFEQKEKEKRQVEREGAKKRKHEKLMKPRVENISQLLAEFPELAEK